MHSTVRRGTHKASLVGKKSEAKQALASTLMPGRVRVLLYAHVDTADAALSLQASSRVRQRLWFLMCLLRAREARS